MKRLVILLQTVLFFTPSLFSQETWYFQWQGYTRVCIVDFPQGRSGQIGLPVVFNLHWYDGTYVEARNYLQTHVLGDSVGFITVYPNAIEKHWNSGISDNPSFPTPNVNDVGFVSLIIDSLISRYKIDSQRVYSCGYSNGGFMSFKLAGQLGGRIAAVASVGGIISNGTASSYSTTKPVPTLLIHGTIDRWVPYSGGQTGWFSVDQTKEFFRNRNLCELPAETLYVPDIDPNDQSTVEKYTYLSVTNKSQVILFKIIGGGHEWPGGPSLDASVINRDIDANKEIWNFFKQFTTVNVTAVQDFDKSYPKDFSLSQNYPNPFNPSTTIRYALPSSTHVKVAIHDILGREIATLVNEEQNAGWKEVQWNAGNVASGVYFYRITAGEFVETKKMVLLR